jgi:uncharacterized protein (TIGR00288 family)
MLEHKIALLVDGPNMFNTDLEEIASIAGRYGSLCYNEIFLKKDASIGTRYHAEKSGFVMVFNSKKDVDTALVLRAGEMIYSPRFDFIDMIAIASGDSDYLPVINAAKENGKRTLVIGKADRSSASVMKKKADYFEAITEKN